MKKWHLLVLALFCLSPFTWAEEPVSVGYFGSTAIGGHDTLAYHRISADDKAIKGNKRYTVEWKGAQWHFLTQEDSLLFAQDPEKYSPAYNGHCANALSLGEGLINTNGKYWAIFDDQLYLFYAPRGAKRWLSGDYKEYKKEADLAWSKILVRLSK